MADNDFGMRAVLTADITSFEGAMLAAFNVAKGFAVSFKNVMSDSINSVSKQFKDSGNFDISIGSFQKLQFAADQTQTSLGSLKMAMRQLDKQIGEATFGNKKSTTLFKQLGLDPAELARNPIDQTLSRVSAALKEIGNTAQAVDIAGKLFGARSGAEALQFIKDLDEMSKKFDRLLKPQTEPEGSDIFQAKQALLEVSAIIDNIWNQLAAKFATPLRNIVTMFEEWGFNGRNVASVMDDIYDGFRKITLAGMPFFIMLRNELSDAIEQMRTLANLDMALMKFSIDPKNGLAELAKQVIVSTGVIGSKQLRNPQNAFVEALDLTSKIFNDLPFSPRGGRSGELLGNTNPVGFAQQITSAANIGSMQMAAKEVQEVHAPGVEKAIDNLTQVVQGGAGTVGVFGP